MSVTLGIMQESEGLLLSYYCSMLKIGRLVELGKLIIMLFVTLVERNNKVNHQKEHEELIYTTV